MIFAIMFPNFIAAAGITVIASVLGIAGEIFGISQSLAMWLMTGFMLTYVTFMPILGKLSDNYGKKKVFITSISIFTAGLLLSAVTNSFAVIIAGRLLQGLGAAGILPITNAMVSEYFPEQKGKYLAMVNATYGLGVIAGVNIGGITYESLGWKWMFLIPFIVGVISVLTALILVKEDKTREYRKKRIDYTGGILFALSITAFILMMGKLSNFSFFSSGVLILFTLLIVSFILFLVREIKTENPVIDLSHFKNPGFLIYNLMALFFGTAMFIFTTFLPSFTQSLLGYSVSLSVYAIDPFAAAMIIFIMIGGVLIKKYGARITMIIGSLLFLAGSFVFAEYVFGEASFYLNSVLLAVGLGISMTPMNYIIIEEGGVENQGSSAGIVSIMRSLGGVIGPTIAGLIMSHIDFSSLFVMDSILSAYSGIFSFAAYSVVLMLLLSITGYFINKKRISEVSI